MRNVEDLKAVINKFDDTHILVIGDMMLDQYIMGTVSRISPEAPVPIVDFSSEIFKPGGAANAISNIRSLGGKVIPVGIIGNDMNGRKLINLLKKNRINTEGIFTIQNRPTIIKTRIIAAQQQIMRIDQENRNNLENKWNQKIFDFINSQIYNVDAILISDYDKGLITDKLIETVVSIARKNNKPIIVDPKVDHFLIYKDITVITPNLKEASIATGINFINEASIVNMGQWLLAKLRCDAVLITRGKDGMSLFEKNGNVAHIPTVARAVFDVTGAGDTVTAVVTLCLATGAGMIESATIANVAAGLVVEKLGTATVTKEELKKRIHILRDRNDFYKIERS